jgi:hypothetical protein
MIKPIIGWLLLPMAAGLTLSIAFAERPAHACTCIADETWLLERESVESSDPNVHDDELWATQARLSANDLVLSWHRQPSYSRLEWAE